MLKARCSRAGKLRCKQPLSPPRGHAGHGTTDPTAPPPHSPPPPPLLLEELLVEEEDEQVDVDLGLIEHLHDGYALVLQLQQVLRERGPSPLPAPPPIGAVPPGCSVPQGRGEPARSWLCMRDMLGGAVPNPG